METPGKIPHVTTQTFNVSMAMTLLSRNASAAVVRGDTQLPVTLESRFWMLDAIKSISCGDLRPHMLTRFQPSGFTQPFSKE